MSRRKKPDKPIEQDNAQLATDQAEPMLIARRPVASVEPERIALLMQAGESVFQMQRTEHQKKMTEQHQRPYRPREQGGTPADASAEGIEASTAAGAE